jgi:hypothetical protein
MEPDRMSFLESRISEMQASQEVTRLQLEQLIAAKNQSLNSEKPTDGLGRKDPAENPNCSSGHPPRL